MIELRVLGALQVSANRPDGAQGVITQPKRLALLLYLALAEPPGLHARDRVLSLLWPEADDASARHSLRNALHALRRVLGDAAIVTRGEAFVGLDPTALRCDALELRAHLAAGRLEEAVALWTGDLAPGFHVSGAPDFEHWLDEQRVTLRRAVRAAAWKRADELKGAGPAEVDAVRRAVRLDPGDEPGARRLIRLLAAVGDRGGALRVYQALADHLGRELEAEPSAETRALAAALRATEPTVPPVELPAPVIEPATPVPAVQSLSPTTARIGGGRRLARGVIAATALAVLALGSAAYFSRYAAARALPSQPHSEAERAVLRLPARYRADTSAYRSYLRGLTLRFQYRLAASRDTLAALVDREPLYVPGLYGLAHAYGLLVLNDMLDPEETWPKIDALALRALALDSTAASAWLVLAGEDMYLRLDLARADERLRHAQALDSLDPDIPAIRSVWYRINGRMDSAVAEARRAHRIDPLSVHFERLLARQLFYARRYEESRQVYSRIFEEDTAWTRGYVDMADLSRAMGRPRETVEWLRRARLAAGDTAAAAALTPPSSDAEAVRLLASDARRTIARLDDRRRRGLRVPPSPYAIAHALLGDTVATLQWLDSIVVHHDTYVNHVRVNPVFDFVRGDPRYAQWEAGTGLPPFGGTVAAR